MFMPLSYILIGLNVLFYVLIAVFHPNDLSAHWKIGSLHNGLITLKGEYFRFLTALFLHANVLHLLMNMFSLFFIGPFVEKVLGRYSFWILYVFCGLASTLSSYYFTLHSIHLEYSTMESVGASGAIFGLVGGLWTCLWKDSSLKINPDLRKRLLLELGILLGINLVFGFVGNALFGLNLDNAGHLGGMLAGVGLAFILKKSWLQLLKNVLIWSTVILLGISFVWSLSLYFTEKRLQNTWVLP